MSNLTEHDLAVARQLGSLQATQESTLRAIESLREAVGGRLKPLEERVTSLEKWRYSILGGAAVIAYLVQYIPKLFL